MTTQLSIFDVRATGKIHFARVSNSPRLQRVLAMLEAARPGTLTTREIIEKAHVCAVSACVDELRENGYAIECQREGRCWHYRLS